MVSEFSPDMDQLAHLLEECHLHEEKAALRQVMLPVGAVTGGPPAQTGPFAPSSSPAHSTAGSECTTTAIGPWADEMMRRLQGCSSTAEGRAVCAQLLTEFQQQLEGQAAQGDTAALGSALMALSLGATPEHSPHAAKLHLSQQLLQAQQQVQQLQARLHALQGANRVIVRALRTMSERQRQLGTRCHRAEEAASQLATELQLRDEQLQASERAKANVQLHLQLLLRQETGPFVTQAHMSGPPCS